MKRVKAVISVEVPTTTEVLWLKPEGGNFVAYLFNGGKWAPLTVAYDNNTATTIDDLALSVEELAEKAYRAAAGIRMGESDDNVLLPNPEDNNLIDFTEFLAYLSEIIDNAGGGHLPVCTMSTLPGNPQQGDVVFCTNIPDESKIAPNTKALPIFFNGYNWILADGTQVTSSQPK